MKRLAYYFDFIAWPLLALLILVMRGPSLLNVAGFYAWPLFEYGLHCWFLHETAWGRRIHEAHHDDPHSTADPEFWYRTGLSFAVTAAFVWALPGFGLDLLAGFAAAYAFFIAQHHAIHHWRISRWHPFYAAKMRHVAHHKIDGCNYGVTTSFWDRQFHTEHQP